MHLRSRAHARFSFALLAVAVSALALGTLDARQAAFTTPPGPVAVNTLARDIYRQLIEINTTESAGGSTRAAEAMAARLLAGGFAPDDVKVLGPNERPLGYIVVLGLTSAEAIRQAGPLAAEAGKKLSRQLGARVVMINRSPTP